MSIIGNQVSGCSANSHGAITKYTLPISALIFTHYLEYIYGINPVLASLSAQRREFQRLYMNITERQAGRQSNPLIEQISQMSKNYGVKVKYTLLQGISCLIAQTTKVFIGASYVLGNGGIVSTIGSSMVAYLAS